MSLTTVNFLFRKGKEDFLNNECKNAGQRFKAALKFCERTKDARVTKRRTEIEAFLVKINSKKRKGN